MWNCGNIFKIYEAAPPGPRVTTIISAWKDFEFDIRAVKSSSPNVLD